MRKPTGESFRERVRAYYESNPEEALSAHDMAVKFGVTLHTARTVLKELVRAGIVVYAPQPVYVAGPAIERRRAA